MHWEAEGSSKKQKTLTPGQAKSRMMKYCAYQERSQHELRQKLYAFGLYSSEVEEIIVELIEQNFVNEERFARAYAGGKFRMKQWGRHKIKQGLQQHRISAYCLKVAMEEISEEEYRAALQALLEKKWKSLKGQSPYIRKNKCAQYAMGKGFEGDLIWEVLKEIELE